MPGVVMAFDAVELDSAGFGTLKCRFVVPNTDGTPMKQPPRHALARDKVRFAGDPVACVDRDKRRARARCGGSRHARHRRLAGRDGAWRRRGSAGAADL